MLCITRRVGESIHIGGPCVITLVELRRGAAKLGIEAGRDVRIARAELLDCDGKWNPKIKRGAE
jgi:carbon storage regulator